MSNEIIGYRNKLHEISLQDRATLEDVERSAERIKAARLEGIDSFCLDIREKIKALQDEKHEIMRSPKTKEELLIIAKQELRRHREEISLTALRKHLEECQRRGDSVPLWPTAMSVGIFNERNAWKLCYLVLTEETLEKLVEELPDTGLSEKQREAKVKIIDQKISALIKQLEDASK